MKLKGIVSRPMARAMVLAASVASTDETRPISRVVVERIDRAVQVIATDTYRLVRAKIADPGTRWLRPTAKQSWLVPAWAIRRALSTQRSRAIGLLALDGLEVAAGGGNAVVTKPDDWGGVYPSYTRILEAAPNCRLQFRLSQLASAARFALGVGGRAEIKRLYMQTGPGDVLRLYAFNRVGDTETGHLGLSVVPCSVEWEPMPPRCVNAHFLCDPLGLALELFGDQDLVLRYGHESRPLVFSFENEEMAVEMFVMPMRRDSNLDEGALTLPEVGAAPAWAG